MAFENTLLKCLHTSNDDPAIIISDKTPTTISHKSLASNIHKLQQNLTANGIEKGTKVSLVLTSQQIFTTTFLALTLNSATVAPLNHGLKNAEFTSYLQDFGAQVLILSPEDAEKGSAAFKAAQTAGLRIATASVEANEVAITFTENHKASPPESSEDPNTPSLEDIALVLHTSGTTGKPKAVPLTHGNIARSITNIITHYSLTSTDRAPVIMPLFHIHGLVAGLFAPLASGGAVIFTPKGGLAPSFLRDAVAHKATWYTGTPTLHRLAAQMPMKEKPSFRFVRSCSSRLEGALAKQLGERYDCPIVEAYAMTEAAHQVCSNPVSVDGTREGSVGKPTGVELKIMDDGGEEVKVGEIGEVAIKGENVMAGYLDNAEANQKSFTAGGFFRTGDQGKVTEDGYVILTGRIKELVNKGGEKISPVEIDNVINQHPDVEEGVAFAMPDEMYGEDVGAAVILKSGAELSEKDLKAYVGERLLQAKVPKKVFFVTEIPKTPVGKMQRGLVAKKMLGENS